MNILRSRFSNNLIINFLFVTALSLGMATLLNYVVNRRELIHQTHWELQQISREQALMIGETLLDDIDLLNTLSVENVIQTKLRSLEQDYAKQSGDIKATLQQQDRLWATAPDDDPLVENVLKSPMTQELEKFLDRFSVYSEVLVTDRHGGLVAATYPVENYYQGDQTWWKTVWNDGQGSLYISQPFFDEAAANPIAEIVIARPIYRGDRVVGALHGIYPLDYVLENMDSAALKLGGWEITESILNESGSDQAANSENLEVTEFEDFGTSGIRLYISPKQYLEVDRLQNNAPITTQLIANPSEAPVNFEGRDAFVTVEPIYTLTNTVDAEEQKLAQVIANLDWRILVYLDEQDALSPLTASAVLVLLTAVVAFCVAIGLAAILAKKVGRPVQVLIDTAQKIQTNSQTPEDLRQLDEIAAQKNDMGELATVFGDMTRVLINRQKNLSQEVASLKTQIRAGLQQTRIKVGNKQASGLELAYYEALLKKSVWLRQKRSKVGSQK